MNDFWKSAVAAHDHTLVLSLLAAGLRLDEARDVAQEAWLRVMESAVSGRLTHVELPGLVIRQASFIVTDRVRARRVRLNVSVDEAADVAGASAADQPSRATELLEVLERGLVEATARERSVLRSTLVAPDAGHDSLAREAGISVQRFRQVLCSVRAKLRRVLEGA